MRRSKNRLLLGLVLSLGLVLGLSTVAPAADSFPYEWVYHVPENPPDGPVYIIVDASSTPMNDPAEALHYAQLRLDTWQWTSAWEKYAILVPADYQQYDPFWMHTNALGRRCFSENTPEGNRRVDLKVLAMIDQLNGILAARGHEISHKVFVAGFSIGGIFANRFSLLHPDRVIAFAAGGVSVVEFPFEVHQPSGRVLDWSLGIANYEELMGHPFDQEAYRAVGKYFYNGENDTLGENSYVNGEVSDYFTPDEVAWLRATFGDPDPVRVENMVQYMRDQGWEVTSRVYPDHGHDGLIPLFAEDILEFFEGYR